MTVIDAEQEAKGKGNQPPPLFGDSHRDGGARARTRVEEGATGNEDAPTEEVQEAASDSLTEELVNRWTDEAGTTWRRLIGWLGRDSGLLAEHPPAPRDLIRYWKTAPMAGGSGFWRWLQRIDGYSFGAAFTVIGYTIAWLGQRPMRRSAAILVFLIVWKFN